MSIRVFVTVLICVAVVAMTAAFPIAAAAGDGPSLDGRPPDGFVGGEYPRSEHVPHVTAERRREIEEQIRRNVLLLRAQGRLAAPSRSSVPLGWPVRPANGLVGWDYHGISNFVDQNGSYPDLLLDYDCGTRTYDLSSGYNHRGTDIFNWPFPWLRMDNNQVEIVAAAPGTIVFRSDGSFDRNCAFNNDPWNAVYVMHADGSIAWYGHMKNGSVTKKTVGQTVDAGERLGVVGSSGSSTGPHLHFEIWADTEQTVLNDPFQGPCNSMNANSWWSTQRPYYDSGVNAMTTGFAFPITPACPDPETPNTQSLFTAGDTIYFTTFLRDQLLGQVMTMTIYRPNGTVWFTWESSLTEAPHYAASWWGWFFTNFAPGGPDGIWHWEIRFESETYSIPFVLGVPPAAGRVPSDTAGGNPLTVAKAAGTEVALTWDGSCLASDSDYAIFEGLLQAPFDTHTKRTCSTAGTTAATIEPEPDSAYFLVVPVNGFNEGSYGLDGAGAERSVGLDTCYPQAVGSCP